MRKLVIVSTPPGILLSNEEVDEIRRRLREIEGSGQPVESLVIGGSCTFEVVEGDEVLLRLADPSLGGGVA